jgi:hypothetical protein
LIASFRKFCAADFLNVLLERKSVDRIYSQVRENLDAILKLEVDAEKEATLLAVGSFKRRGVSDSPMRGYRLTRPHRTLLGRRLVADGENEIDTRAVGGGELVPALGS